MPSKNGKTFSNQTLVRLLRENLRAQAFNYSIAMIAMVFIAATSALTAWMMKDIINSIMESGNTAQVLGVAAAVATVFIVKGAANYVQMVWLGKAGFAIVAAQQRKLFSSIVKHSLSFFSAGNSSELLMRVTMSARGARTVVDTIVTGFVRDLLTVIGLVAVMFLQQPVLSLLFLIVGPLALLGVRIILRYVREFVAGEMTGTSEIIKIIQETSTGIRVVKAFDLEANVSDRMDVAITSVEEKRNAIRRLEAMTSPLMETLAGLAIAGVVALSAFNLFGPSQTSAGEIMSFITAVFMAYEPSKRLARMRIVIERGMKKVEMMYQILDQPIDVQEKPNAVPVPEGEGRVSIEEVNFAYNDGESVLRDLTLDFPAGKKTALVGPSGGGKSTIMNLIMRLYDPTNGSVKINGTDLREVKFNSLRQQISFVGQDSFLFDGTIKSNIAIGREGATDEQIIKAAIAANAHDFITELSDGYDSEVGENGSSLSGGQRQRITIARAILRDNPILLMDEPTSALDSESEFLVKEGLDRLTFGRTVIIIAHRLSTILDADHIIVIRDGQVAEQGSLNELLEANGLFKSLYDHQFNDPKQYHS